MSGSLIKKNKFKADVGLGIVSILLAMHIACKIFTPELSRYIGLIISAVAFFMYAKFPKLRASLLIVGATSLDDLMLGIVAAGIILMAAINRLSTLKISKIEIFILCNLILLLLINIFSGGPWVNNATRLIAISIPLIFILGNLNIAAVNQVRGVAAVYYVLIAGQILFYYIGGGDRSSIFNGSENIAYVIFAIILVYIFALSHSRFEKLTAIIAFIYFVNTTDSRTGVLFSIIILLWFLVRILNIKKILLILMALGLITSVLTGRIDNLGEEYARYTDAAKYIASGEFNFDTLSLVDIRGALYQEGIGVWERNKYFGTGAYSSEILQEMLGDKGMHEFHNIIIDLLVQYGVAGLILVAINYILIFASAINHAPGIAKKDIVFLFAFYFGYGMFQPLVFNYQAAIILYFCAHCLSRNFGRLSSCAKYN